MARPADIEHRQSADLLAGLPRNIPAIRAGPQIYVRYQPAKLSAALLQGLDAFSPRRNGQHLVPGFGEGCDKDFLKKNLILNVEE